MAEQIISPGVFTRENDQSFLPQGIGQIGAAIVGPTVKGPAFVPTVVRSFSEYEKHFGPLSNETFVPQTVREYLKNAGSVTVCRVLAGSGATYSIDGTVNQIFALVANTTKATCTITCADGDATISTDSEEEAFTITDGNGTSKVFVLCDDTLTTITTGTIIAADTDVGSTSTPAAGSVGGIAVVVNIASSEAAQHEVLTELATAINHANGFGGTSGTIQAGTVSGTSDGAQTITLTSNIGGVQPLATTETTGEFTAQAWSNVTEEDKAQNVLMGFVFPSKSTGEPDLSTTTMLKSPLTGSFALELNGAQGVTATTVSCSFSPSNNAYIEKQLGKDPNNSKTGVVAYNGTPGYLQMSFRNLHKAAAENILTTTNAATAFISGQNANLNAASLITGSVQIAEIKFTGGPNMSQNEAYSMASTPFITSQFVDENKTTKELFRIHTLAHGSVCNQDYKISITDLKEPSDIDGQEQYSRFTVAVRRYDDKDSNPQIIEEYKGVNLDPHDVNYISRRIGDRYPQYNDSLGKVELLGNFPNVSNLIRVEVTDAVDARSISPKLSPKGFKALLDPIPSSSFSADVGAFYYPSCSYEGTQVVGSEYSVRGMLGWKFDDKATDNSNWLQPTADGALSNVVGEFNVENYSGHANSGLYTSSLSA